MLEQLLEVVTTHVRSFAVCEVRNGLTLGAPALGSISLHYVLRGEGELITAHRNRVKFTPNSLVVCPPGQSVEIREVQGEYFSLGRCHEMAHSLHWLRAGEGENPSPEEQPGMLVICGIVDMGPEKSLGLFDSLTAPLILDSDNDETQQIFARLFGELTNPGLGSTAMLSVLMKQCLILMLRQIHNREETHPWLLAMHDPAMARVINTMLREPQQQINIEQLASLANMGRSTFVERFKAVFGDPPHRFAIKIRLQHAAKLLAHTSLPVKMIADQLGYRSRSQFSAAFKAYFHQDPGSYRQKLP